MQGSPSRGGETGGAQTAVSCCGFGLGIEVQKAVTGKFHIRKERWRHEHGIYCIRNAGGGIVPVNV